MLSLVVHSNEKTTGFILHYTSLCIHSSIDACYAIIAAVNG